MIDPWGSNLTRQRTNNTCCIFVEEAVYLRYYQDIYYLCYTAPARSSKKLPSSSFWRSSYSFRHSLHTYGGNDSVLRCRA